MIFASVVIPQGYLGVQWTLGQAVAARDDLGEIVCPRLRKQDSRGSGSKWKWPG